MAMSLAYTATLATVMSEPRLAIPFAVEISGKGSRRNGGNTVHEGLEGCCACGDDADVELQAVRSLRVSIGTTVRLMHGFCCRGKGILCLCGDWMMVVVVHALGEG